MEQAAAALQLLIVEVAAAEAHARLNSEYSRGANVGFVYVLSNPVMPGILKIGRTDAEDVGRRISQLYTTGVPVPFTIEFAAQVADPVAVEDALHRAFAPSRINPSREFFRLEVDQPLAILKLLHVHDDTAKVQSEVTEIDAPSLAAAEQQKKRRPNFNFKEMGIPVGSVLQYAHSEATAVVKDERLVEINGEEMYLTAATTALMGTPYAVQPGRHWTFEGRSLADIYEETYAS